MIVLYSGTPGSGKSLDAARTIRNWARRGAPIICNFPINTAALKLRKEDQFSYWSNNDLKPDRLVEFSKEHFKDQKCKEDSILLIIDEAQLLFNARDWSAKGRDRWTWFFTMHRHFGFFIILCAQFDRMLDRQVRSLIEYEYIHRKVTNIGWRGMLLSCLMLLSPNNLFVKVKVWYPMKEKVGSELFRRKSRDSRLYDTFAMLDARRGRQVRKKKVEKIRAFWGQKSPRHVPVIRGL